MHQFCLRILMGTSHGFFFYNDHECDLAAKEVLYSIIQFLNDLEILK